MLRELVAWFAVACTLGILFIFLGLLILATIQDRRRIMSTPTQPPLLPHQIVRLRQEAEDIYRRYSNPIESVTINGVEFVPGERLRQLGAELYVAREDMENLQVLASALYWATNRTSSELYAAAHAMRKHLVETFGLKPPSS